MKTLKEVIVVVVLAILCAVVVNWKINPTPFPWVHEERPVTASSDSLLNSMLAGSGSAPSQTSLTPTQAGTGTSAVPAQASVQALNSATSPALSHKDSVALLRKQDSLKKATAQHPQNAAAGVPTSGGQPSQQTSQTSTTTAADAPATKLPISLSYEQVLKLLANPGGVAFIDARKEEEHAKGSLANSMNVDMLQFPADPEYRSRSMRLLYSIPKEKVVVAYCGGGNCELSHELCDVLIQMGFKKVFIYLGGWNEYAEKQGIKK